MIKSQSLASNIHQSINATVIPQVVLPVKQEIMTPQFLTPFFCGYSISQATFLSQQVIHNRKNKGGETVVNIKQKRYRINGDVDPSFNAETKEKKLW